MINERARDVLITAAAAGPLASGSCNHDTQLEDKSFVTLKSKSRRGSFLRFRRVFIVPPPAPYIVAQSNPLSQLYTEEDESIYKVLFVCLSVRERRENSRGRVK